MNYSTYYNQGTQPTYQQPQQMGRQRQLDPLRPLSQQHSYERPQQGGGTAGGGQTTYAMQRPTYGLSPTMQYAQDRGDYAQQMMGPPMGQQGQYGQQQPRYGWLQNQKGMERNPLGMMGGGGGGMLGGMGSGPQPMYGSSQAGERGGIAEQNFWGLAGGGRNRFQPWEQQTPQMQQGYGQYNRPPLTPINRPMMVAR
jgi:hypothetical protein